MNERTERTGSKNPAVRKTVAKSDRKTTSETDRKTSSQSDREATSESDRKITSQAELTTTSDEDHFKNMKAKLNSFRAFLAVDTSSDIRFTDYFRNMKIKLDSIQALKTQNSDACPLNHYKNLKIKFDSIQAFLAIEKNYNTCYLYKHLFRIGIHRVLIIFMIYRALKQCVRDANSFIFVETEENRLYRKFLNMWKRLWQDEMDLDSN